MRQQAQAWEQERCHLRAPLPPRGQVALTLVYPGSYAEAASHLGYLTVYHLFNAYDHICCQRALLPEDQQPWRTLEYGSLVACSEVVAVSLSFENDYLRLPGILAALGLPWLARDRAATAPLLICGGVCAFLNPEPIGEVFDLLAVGEGEVLLPSLAQQLHPGAERAAVSAALCQQPGWYAPAYHHPQYADGGLQGWRHDPPAPSRIQRQFASDWQQVPPCAPCVSPAASFSDMALTEVARGCGRGCRFCAAGFIYRPVRMKDSHRLWQDVDEALSLSPRVGLVGAAVSDHPQSAACLEYIHSQGGSAGVASLRAESLSEGHLWALQQAQQRTLTLAPEAGSQHLRNFIHKGLTQEGLEEAVCWGARSGMLHLKLYYMLGLPGEEPADLEALGASVVRLRQLWVQEQKAFGRLGQVHISITPFIPKPFTPLQWAPMASSHYLQQSYRQLQKQLGRLPNLKCQFESIRQSLLQGVLARGGRELVPYLPQLASVSNWQQAARRLQWDWQPQLHQWQPWDTVFPWELIDNGISRSWLEQDCRQALAERG